MRLFRLLTSTKVTLVLLIAFALAMAAATFIENDHGTPVARAEVYEAWWFELLMGWMALNFLLHIGQYRLLSAAKWPIGLFHLSFVLILVGAGVTRYFGKEGMVHIREGQTARHFITAEHYVRLATLPEQHGTAQQLLLDRPINLAARSFQPISLGVNGSGQVATLRIEEHLKQATEVLSEGADTLLSLAIADGSGRQDFYLKPGQLLRLSETRLLALSPDPQADIRLYREQGRWTISSKTALGMMEMSTQQMGTLPAEEPQPLRMQTLYQYEGGAFVLKGVHEGVQLSYKPAEAEARAEAQGPEVIRFSLLATDGTPLAETYYLPNYRGEKWQTVQTPHGRFALSLGPKEVPLPFGLRLDRFELTRYPGSQSPSGYASLVSVLEGSHSHSHRIFMNNVLDHSGYRFYQSSYDTDEKGTVLSVNQDRPGTLLTYAGYTLLTLGMLGTFLAKGSRFSFLRKRLSRLQQVGAAAAVALLPGAFASPAQAQIPVVPIEKADAYGRLVVQDLDGRMKPLNTLANEIVRKIGGKSAMHLPDGQKLSAEQFLLAAQLAPQSVSELPLIKADSEKAPLICQTLQVPPTSQLAFRQFINEEGRYLLQELVEEANRLKPAERNEGHKELLKVDERFNIFYALLTGDFLRLFPNRHDAANTWFTAGQHQMGFDEQDAVFVRNITSIYLQGIAKGLAMQDWADADEALGYIDLYQQKAGAAVYPPAMQLSAELHYNQLRLGTRLFGVFWLLGAALLALALARLFSERPWLSVLWKAGTVLAWVGMAAYTYHLGLRWYIANHPPWSDGFEMLLFVAWGVLASGLLLAGRSRFTMPVGLLFSGTLLFVAFLDWLNPEITNLMPVLHSYWLKIHVAVIVGSYAPLALGAVLGLLLLFLLIFKPSSPTQKWWASMQELTLVNEKALTIGLFLLTIGTFLGGVWANESWGRYWAWDPKETWALISIILYAAVLHLRLIPKLKNVLMYNLASMWVFSSIVMTSFGVNYYLSGLHSYAKGDPVPIPEWVYWTLAALATVSALAVLRYRTFSAEEKDWLEGKSPNKRPAVRQAHQGNHAPVHPHVGAPTKHVREEIMPD